MDRRRRRARSNGGDMKAGRIARWAAAVGASVVMASLALAGNHWKFNLVNKSNIAAVEFRTQQNGQWSANWISDQIRPGETFNMDFASSDGDCSLRTQIRFADGSRFDASVDYCKLNNLYIRSDSLTSD
jgi:hypothetical protein